MSFKRLKGKICIDLGCGENKNAGFLGLDKRPLPGVDIVHDVEIFPWPIETKTVSVIAASHLVEHIKPWLIIDFMNEAWRILEDNGLFLISTPYAGSFRYFQDPTHCTPWNEATVAYFLKGTPLYDVYKPKPWKSERVTYVVNGDLEMALRKIDDSEKPKPKVEKEASR